MNNEKIKAFKFNSKRQDSLSDSIDNIREELGNSDVRDVRAIEVLLEDGLISSAIEAYNLLDTVVREMLPQWLGELAGYTTNPAWHSFEDSLQGTE